MQRRRFTLALLPAALWPPLAGASRAAGEAHMVQVWKSPDCGCCKDWVAHLRANGFVVKTYDIGNTDARERLGIPLALGSCHTGSVGGYAVEGHVPAREIRRLLAERPKGAVGLAVPGMPVGSPGMDGPEYGARRDLYDVLLVLRDGSSTVYQSYHRTPAAVRG